MIDYRSLLGHEWTVDEYIAALKDHDWSYDFSDDHRVWARGHNQLQRLRRAQRRLDPDFKIWNQHCHERCKNGATYA